MTDPITERLDAIEARATDPLPPQQLVMAGSFADLYRKDVPALISALRGVLALASVWDDGAMASDREGWRTRALALRTAGRGVRRTIASALDVTL